MLDANFFRWCLPSPLYPFCIGVFAELLAMAMPIPTPCTMILGYLTPIAVVGITGLAVLWRYGMAAKTSVIAAAVISLCFTLAPLIFGLWLWYESNVLHLFSLQYWAWWLSPFSALWLAAYVMSLVTLNASFTRKHGRFNLVLLYTSLLLILGAILAWIFITNDFALSLVNAFAIIPFIVACLKPGARMVFHIWKENHTA